MNNNIIPLSRAQVLNGGTLNTQNILLFEAIEDCVVSASVFQYSAGTNATFTLKAGAHLFHLKSITWTGVGAVYYAGNPVT